MSIWLCLGLMAGLVAFLWHHMSTVVARRQLSRLAYYWGRLDCLLTLTKDLPAAAVPIELRRSLGRLMRHYLTKLEALAPHHHQTQQARLAVAQFVGRRESGDIVLPVHQHAKRKRLEGLIDDAKRLFETTDARQVLGALESQLTKLRLDQTAARLLNSF